MADIGEITISLPRTQYLLLAKRYERSLEKDAEREKYINPIEFETLKKLLGMQ